MAENKTRATDADVGAFLAGVEPEERRADAKVVAEIMGRLSGEPATLWGPNIVGFGNVHYRYESGREGDMPRIAFSPRKPQLVLYGLGGADRFPELMARLGKHSTGKSCVYIRRLKDVDLGVLEQLVAIALAVRAETPE